VAVAADRPNLIRVMPAKGCSCRRPFVEAVDLNREQSAAKGRQPAQLPQGADLLVVGAGLAGLVCAWRAAATGAEVVVCDAPGRPAAASVAAGMIAPVGESSWGEERTLDAATSSAARWPEFARELEEAAGSAVPYRRCGALHVALDRDEAAELRRRHRLHERHSLAAEELLGSDCRRLEPGLATTVTAGVSAPAEAEVDPRALLSALRAATRAAGGQIIEAEVHEIDATGTGVRLADGHGLAVARVAICAGAWAGDRDLLPPGRRLPVRPVKGEILRLRADPDALPCERIIVGERFYLVPRAGGEVVVGASSEESGFDLRVTAGAVHELLREAYRALPELAELELVEIAAGLRPGSPDNAPIIGVLDDDAGSLIAAGLYRNGVLLAPILAAAFDALLAGDAPPPELAALTPDRFGARELESLR
jgi:glycine oxidase